MEEKQKKPASARDTLPTYLGENMETRTPKIIVRKPNLGKPTDPLSRLTALIDAYQEGRVGVDEAYVRLQKLDRQMEQYEDSFYEVVSYLESRLNEFIGDEIKQAKIRKGII